MNIKKRDGRYIPEGFVFKPSREQRALARKAKRKAESQNQNNAKADR